MSTAPSRRLRMQPHERRALIIESATQLLGARGYWALTMAEVAKDVGVTTQAVLHYFTSKDALMLAVLEHRDEVDIHMVAPRHHPTRDAREFVAAMTALVARNAQRPEMVRLYTVLGVEAIEASHPAHAFFQRRLLWGIRSMSELVAPWHPAPRDLAVHVHSVMDGLQLNWLRSPEVDLVRDWETWAAAYFDLPIRGLLSEVS